MKKTMALASAVGLLTIAGTAPAAPLGTQVPKILISDTDKLIPAKKFTLAEAQKRKRDFSLTKSYRTPSGRTITGQQYIDLANQLQAAAERGGCTLGSGKSCNFVVAPARLSKAQLSRTATMAAYTLKLKAVQTTKKATDKEAKEPLGFTWSNEWGDRSTGAVYVGAEFGNNGTSSSSSCGGDAYAGVYLFGQKKDVIRLEGEAGTSGSTVSASAALYILGESVWSKSGSFSLDTLSFEKSFSVSKSFTYWGLVTVNLSAKATASAYVKGSISGTAKSGEYTCTLNITPGVKATVGGSAEVALVGYGELSAAAVGVEADVTLADIKVPIVASASAKNASNKVTFSESLQVDLNMTYLKGSLDAYFKTSIPLDGERIWDWDSDKFTFTLLEWNGYSYNQSLFKKTQSQTL